MNADYQYCLNALADVTQLVESMGRMLTTEGDADDMPITFAEAAQQAINHLTYLMVLNTTAVVNSGPSMAMRPMVEVQAPSQDQLDTPLS